MLWIIFVDMLVSLLTDGEWVYCTGSLVDLLKTRITQSCNVMYCNARVTCEHNMWLACCEIPPPLTHGPRDLKWCFVRSWQGTTRRMNVIIITRITRRLWCESGSCFKALWLVVFQKGCFMTFMQMTMYTTVHDFYQVYTEIWPTSPETSKI